MLMKGRLLNASTVAVLFVLVCTAQLGIAPHAVPAQSEETTELPVAFEDDFESYAIGAFPYDGGWELAFDGAGGEYQVIVNDVSVSPTKSLQLVGTPSWAADAIRPIAAGTSRIGFEVCVRVDETLGADVDNARVGFWRRTSSLTARWYALVSFKDSGLIVTRSQILQSYTADTWYRIRLILDCENSTYSVWVNDVLRGENIAEPNDPYEIQALALSSTLYNSVKANFDDIKILGEEVPPEFPVYDDFESYVVGTFPFSGGWTLIYDGAGEAYQKVVDTYSKSPTRSLQLVGSPGWAADAAKSIHSGTQLLGFEVQIRISETGSNEGANARCGFYGLSQGLWPWYLYVQFLRNGSVFAGAPGAGGELLQSYVVGEWYKVGVVYDRERNSYSVWINDVLRGENLPGPSVSYDPYCVEYFAVSGCSYNMVASYYDDVKVYEGETQGTCIHVDPEPREVAAGQEFTVIANVTNVGNLYGLDVQLEWNATAIEYVSHTVTIPVEGTPNGILHEPVIEIRNEVNPSAGTYWIAYSSVNPASAFTGSGRIVEMTFRAKLSGNYTVNVVSSDLADFDGDPIPHTSMVGAVTVREMHDLAVTDISPDKAIVGQSYSCSINVTVVNQGSFTEDSNVILSANGTVVDTVPISVPSGSQWTGTFIWNTTNWTRGSYVVDATATAVANETNTDDNSCTYRCITVTIPGDVEGDKDVDIFDVVKIARSYGYASGDPLYQPIMDIDGDGYINIFDIVIATGNYGESDP
jgi:hypothetical protein